MEIEEILIWTSRISLVFWSVVLIWCVISIALRVKKEREWLRHYVPTLEGDLKETDIRSWTTLNEFQRYKKRRDRRNE